MNRSRGAVLIWLAIALGVVLAVVLTPEAPRPYDLDAADPLGYRGLRLLLESNDVEVERIDAAEVGDLRPVDTTVYVPVPDGASADARSTWRRFVEGGGVLVLGGPSDGIGAEQADIDQMPEVTMVFGEPTPGDCDVPELDDAEQLSEVGSTPLAVTAGDTSCFGDGDTALVVRSELGTGAVITLSTADLFTNLAMGAPEPEQKVGPIPGNALVAERLLGARPTLAVVTDGVAEAPTDGEKTLTDFLPSGVKLAILQIAVAVGIYAVARGRRHGQVVHEPEPVEVAGSAFVDAHGNLLERQGQVARAAEVVRAAAAVDLARAHGMPTSTPAAELARVVAHRTGRSVDEVTACLVTAPVESDAALLDLTIALDSLRQEAHHV